ncbi:MAG: hypothetical protein PQJ46_12280, partial [Spirochaetales bacterium]|nr:hypothetical protein [Spirochaetales bacterium]
FINDNEYTVVIDSVKLNESDSDFSINSSISESTIATDEQINIDISFSPETGASSVEELIITDIYGRTCTMTLQGTNLLQPDDTSLKEDLALWIDASEIRLDDVTKIANNYYVDIIHDKSNREIDLDAVALSDDRRPVYNSAGLNSRPVITFDGSDDCMKIDPGADYFIYDGEEKVTIFIVFTADRTSYSFLLFSGPTYAYWPRLYMSSSRFYEYGNSDFYYSDIGFLSSGNSYLWTSELDLTITDTDEDQLTVWVNDSEKINLYDYEYSAEYVLNDWSGQDTIMRLRSDHSYVNKRVDSFIIGANNSYNYPFKGSLAEIIIYTDVLTSDETSIVRNYLNDKYALW